MNMIKSLYNNSSNLESLGVLLLDWMSQIYKYGTSEKTMTSLYKKIDKSFVTMKMKRIDNIFA